MTTNIERAAEVLRDDKHYKMGPHGEQFLTSEAARSLADAGLLKPSLPTLAELLEAGNDPKQYQWMRAKDSNGEDLYLTRIMEGTSEVVYRDGMTVIDINSEFTPLPDLPKLEWPGGGVEDTPVVDGEPTLPRPEDSDSTSVNGAVTRDSPLSVRVDSLFGYDPTGEKLQCETNE